MPDRLEQQRLWPPAFDELRAEAFDAAVETYSRLASDEAGPPVDALTGLALARDGADDLFPVRCDRAVGRLVSGVPCRVIRPSGGDVVGVYLHFHGGGMCLAGPEHNDVDNLRLADELGLIVISVDYRLAPEHPFPAAIDDATAVARWLVERVEDEFGTGRLLIGGESSGAYLAVMALLGLRRDGIDPRRFAAANLVFGVFDWGRSPSQRGFRPTEGPDWLSPEAMAQFADFYLPGLDDDQRRDESISPAFADLGSMPPALFTVGTLDHMLDDSIIMHARWQVWGSVAELAVYPDCGHGFHWFTDTELSRNAVERIDHFLLHHVTPS